MRLMIERGHQEEGEAAGKWRRALLTSAPALDVLRRATSRSPTRPRPGGGPAAPAARAARRDALARVAVAPAPAHAARSLNRPPDHRGFARSYRHRPVGDRRRRERRPYRRHLALTSSARPRHLGRAAGRGRAGQHQLAGPSSAPRFSWGAPWCSVPPCCLATSPPAAGVSLAARSRALRAPRAPDRVPVGVLLQLRLLHHPGLDAVRTRLGTDADRTAVLRLGAARRDQLGGLGAPARCSRRRGPGDDVDTRRVRAADARRCRRLALRW